MFRLFCECLCWIWSSLIFSWRSHFKFCCNAKSLWDWLVRGRRGAITMRRERKGKTLQNKLHHFGGLRNLIMWQHIFNKPQTHLVNHLTQGFSTGGPWPLYFYKFALIFQNISRLLLNIVKNIEENTLTSATGRISVQGEGAWWLRLQYMHARAGTSVGRKLLSSQNGGPWDKTSWKPMV